MARQKVSTDDQAAIAAELRGLLDNRGFKQIFFIVRSSGTDTNGINIRRVHFMLFVTGEQGLVNYNITSDLHSLVYGEKITKTEFDNGLRLADSDIYTLIRRASEKIFGDAIAIKLKEL